MFVNTIYRHAREQPERLAVINSGQEITYRRFAATIDAVRNVLMRAQLPSDGVIAIITSNLYLDWVLLLALRSLGHTTVAGTSWKVIEGLDLRNLAGLVGFSDQAEAIAAFRRARPDCAVVEMSRRLLAGAAQAAAPPPVEDGPFGDHIVYTSGTTGDYKKLVFKGEGIEHALQDDRYGLTGQYLTRNDVFFCHSFGPWTAVGYKGPLRCWRNGATIIFEQRPDWAEHFFDYPVTMTTFVPGLLDQVCQATKVMPAHRPPLRVQVGGGFLDATVARKLKDLLGCEVMAAYGGTEFRTPLANFIKDDEDVVWLTPTFEPGIEIVDEKDRPLRAGSEGIVRVRSAPYDPAGYLDDPETTARHFRGGYFYPGDMGVRREDGRVRILGRVADVLNLGGQKVAIEPFEQWARGALGVENLCAFNYQSDDGTEKLLVVVEGTRLPDRARLQATARRIKGVKQVRFALMEQFPRGINGMMKVNRRKVLDIVRESDRRAATSRGSVAGITAGPP